MNLPIGFTDSLIKSWDVLKREPLLSLAGFLIYMAMTYVAVYVICIGWIIWFLVLQFPVYGGMVFFYLRIIRGQGADLSLLFSTLNDIGKWLGVGWIYFMIFIVSMLPLAIAGLITGLIIYPIYQSAYISNPAVSGIYIAGMVLIILTGSAITVVLSILFSVRYMFVWYAAADGAGIIESFEQSSRMTAGYGIQLFGIFLGYMLLTIIGSFLLGVGQILAAVLSIIAYGLIYISLLPLISDEPVSSS